MYAHVLNSACFFQMISEWLTPPGHWRSERPDGEMVYQFPYAIMEVKLQVHARAVSVLCSGTTFGPA